MNHEEKRIIGLAALGGMLELYDFAIYGTFAIYFAHQFFPSNNTYTVIIETYMVFLLGFILRPVGGLLFSHIGDEFGRKRVLVYTILIMGLSSIGIACLPTYAQIGITAPILLLLCRLVQGLAMGGELPTTFVYISESIPHKRAIAFGFTMGGVLAGYLFAAIINYALAHIFNQTQLNQYAWRIPFAIGGAICLISYKVRKSLRETPAFKEIMKRSRLPVIDLLQYHWPKVIAGVIFSAVQQIFSIVTIIYMPTYLHALLHLETGVISTLLPYVLMITVLATIGAGLWFNRYSNLNKLMLIVLISNIVMIPIFYYLIAMHISIFTGYILLMIGHGFIALIVPLYLTTLFPVNIRLSGVAISYNLSVASFGGLAPIIITALIKQTNMIFISPVAYIVTFMILAVISVLIIQHRTSD